MLVCTAENFLQAFALGAVTGAVILAALLHWVWRKAQGKTPRR